MDYEFPGYDIPYPLPSDVPVAYNGILGVQSGEYKESRLYKHRHANYTYRLQFSID